MKAHLATGVGILAELHAFTSHEAMQRDEHQVQAVHAALEGVLVILGLHCARRRCILLREKVRARVLGPRVHLQILLLMEGLSLHHLQASGQMQREDGYHVTLATLKGSLSSSVSIACGVAAYFCCAGMSALASLGRMSNMKFFFSWKVAPPSPAGTFEGADAEWKADVLCEHHFAL